MINNVYYLQANIDFVATGLYSPNDFRPDDLVVKCNINGTVKKYPVQQIMNVHNQYCVVDELNDFYILSDYDPFDRVYNWYPKKPLVNKTTGTSVQDYVLDSDFLESELINQDTDGTYYYMSGDNKVPVAYYSFINNDLNNNPGNNLGNNPGNDRGLPVNLNSELQPATSNIYMSISLGHIFEKQLNCRYSSLLFQDETITTYPDEGDLVSEIGNVPHLTHSHGHKGNLEFGYFKSFTTFENTLPVIVIGPQIFDIGDFITQNVLIKAGIINLYGEFVVPARDGLYTYNGQRVDYLSLYERVNYILGDNEITPYFQTIFRSVDDIPGLEPILIPSISVPGISRSLQSTSLRTGIKNTLTLSLMLLQTLFFVSIGVVIIFLVYYGLIHFGLI